MPYGSFLGAFRAMPLRTPRLRRLYTHYLFRTASQIFVDAASFASILALSMKLEAVLYVGGTKFGRDGATYGGGAGHKRLVATLIGPGLLEDEARLRARG